MPFTSVVSQVSKAPPHHPQAIFSVGIVLIPSSSARIWPLVRLFLNDASLLEIYADKKWKSIATFLTSLYRWLCDRTWQTQFPETCNYRCFFSVCFWSASGSSFPFQAYFITQLSDDLSRYWAQIAALVWQHTLKQWMEEIIPLGLSAPLFWNFEIEDGDHIC